MTNPSAQTMLELADKIECGHYDAFISTQERRFTDNERALIVAVLRAASAPAAVPPRKPMKLELSDEWCLSAADREAQGQLAPGCRSASSPCAHQKASPYTLCETCRPSLKTVTIVIPSGYRDAADFLKDCQFEEASTAAGEALSREELAQLIDPQAFRSWQSLYDWCLRENDEAFSKRCADSFHGEKINEAMSRADAIMAKLAAPSAAQTDGVREARPLPSFSASKIRLPR